MDKKTAIMELTQDINIIMQKDGNYNLAKKLVELGYSKICPNALTNELGDIICGNDKSENLSEEDYKKECATCEHCIYIGEGGFMCLWTNKIIMDDFKPLLKDYKTNCKRWKKNG